MGRFDGRDDELTKRNKPVNNLLTCFLFGLMLGFLAGAVWGFFYFESLGMTDAFAHMYTHVPHPTAELKDTMSFGDSITVRLLNGTT